MKKTKLNMTTKKGLLIFAALFILLYVIIYVVPKVTDIFTQTYIAEYGTLEVSWQEECVFVRGEEAYKAPIGGKVSRKAEEGDLLRAGSLVVTVGSHEQYNSQKGLVSYYYDGYEKKVTPENMADLKESFLAEYKENGQVEDAVSATAESGGVLFKIVDNSRWFLVCWPDKEQAKAFEIGQKVVVEPEEGVSLQMTVESLNKQDKGTQLILSCNRNYEDFDRYRIKECKIIASSCSGIIVKTDSISEKDGVKGVYVVDKFNDANFTPIRILSSHGDKTVVEKNYFYDSEGNSTATVKNYDEILKSGKK